MHGHRYLLGAALLAAVLLLWPFVFRPQPVGDVTIFAAASLRDALTRIADDYQRDSGRTLRFSFAASSTLARQIEAGAPADIFVSANEAWMDYLADRGHIDVRTLTRPLGNRLVLVSRARAARDVRIPDIERHLGRHDRLAVGDPAHVPAGAYARQALAGLGLWERLEPRLARAENVRAALALVARGEAPLGIVYATDSQIESGVEIVDVFAEDSHDPIAYSFALLAGSDSVRAHEVLAVLTGERAIAVFEELGFVRR